MQKEVTLAFEIETQRIKKITTKNIHSLNP